MQRSSEALEVTIYRKRKGQSNEAENHSNRAFSEGDRTQNL